MKTRGWVLTGVVGLVTALGAGAFSAAASPARPAGAARVSPAHLEVSAHALKVSGYGMDIGPLTARGGFHVGIEADGCGTKDSAAYISFYEGDSRAGLSHTYAGRATCTVSKTLQQATLKVKWGSAVTLTLTTATTTSLRTVSADDGCASNKLEYRVGRTAGTGRLAIHAKNFGTLAPVRDLVQVFAQLGTCAADSGTSSGAGAGTQPTTGAGTGFDLARQVRQRPGVGFASNAPLRAAMARRASQRAVRPAVRLADTATTGPVTTPVPSPTTPPTTTTPTTTTTSPAPAVTPDASGSQFLGLFDSGAFVASAYDDAPRAPLIILEDLAPHDAPAAGVQADLDVVFQAPQDFTLGAGDDTAELAAANAFASGTLDFTATALCTGSTKALDGTLTGALTLHDPVIGQVIFNGPRAVGAAVGDDDASLETC